MDKTSAEDLRSFEKRLTEVVTHLQPSMWRYRILLVTLIILSVFGAWSWLSDPHTAKLTFYDSLLNHMLFTTSFSTLIVLFFFGIHKKIVASSVITGRCRSVLSEYNMSCDDNGRLILRPRPAQ
ncbi:unnamed protein product [Brachionus calyciflorus]|uniref:Transmembrane protein 188 n=1 Tax=Brachionus calyciflorus TaxID=104777 RepID=A0A814E4W6_9BILA|nr:unnamed protein product [Brachionus calyciflorus]